MATSQDIATWICGEILQPRFLLLCLRGMRRDLLQRLAMGSTHKTVYMPDIASIRIPLPPQDEQRLIVDMTWAKLELLADAQDRLASQIDLLEEHQRGTAAEAILGDGVAA